MKTDLIIFVLQFRATRTVWIFTGRYWREIADECKKTKCGKLLMVEDIKEIVSLTETYQIASEISEMEFSGIRIAFVDRYIE